MSDCIGEVAVYFSGNMVQAAVYPDFRKVRETGSLNLHETIREDVVDRHNRSVAPYKRIMKLHILAEEIPKTRLGKVKRFLLPSLAEGRTRDKGAGHEPDFHEYKAIKDFLREQTEKDIYPGDHFEMDLGLDSLDRVSFQTFLQATFGIEVGEDILYDHPTVEKLSAYVKEKKKKMSVSVVRWAEIFREKTEVTIPTSWFAHNLMKNLSKWTLGLYFRLKGEGVQNLPESPFIIVPNHQSSFDGFFVASFLKNRLNKNTYFYAKEKHFRRWWMKFLASRNNVIVMDIDRDLKLSLQKLAEVLKRGKNIIIFPEGTRTKDGQLGRFKKTFAILSRELNVPVVPVAIKGAFKALPKGSLIPRPLKNIQVKFLKPVYPENNTYDSLNDLVFRKVAAELA
jgi:long-chain acyl-CoA synthetase